MKKVQIVIADDNVEYLKFLSTFIRTSSDASMLVATFFSNQKNLELYMLKEKEIDILLISPNLMEDSLKISSKTTVILLEDDDSHNEYEQYAGVYRYQRLNHLISKMLAIYYEKDEAANNLLLKSKQAKIIATYSPVGGSGKTTVAVNLSRQLAINNSKVFYLNLELFNTTSLYFSSEEDNPSLQLFYYVKSESDELPAKIETLKKYDPYSQVEYFDLEVSPEEMLEINEEDVERLINSIVDRGAYDYIVIDLDSSLHERNLAVLSECDQIIWTLVNDCQSILKTNSFFEMEEIKEKENQIKDKLILLLNKYTDTSISGIEKIGLPISGFLPLVNDWHTVDSGSEILNNDDFIKAIQTIIRKRLLNVEEVRTVDEQ